MTKRRTRGDGGLTQRHDHPTCPPKGEDGTRPEHTCRGRWQGTLDVRDGGKVRRKYVYGRTMREAKVKLDRARRERDEGTLVLATMSTERWLHHWLDNIAARSLRPQTLRGYRSKVDRYLIPHLGHHRLTSLRPEHVRQMYDDLRAEGLSEATIRQTHAILKRALKVAVMERKLTWSPLDAVEAPTTETADRKALTVDQAATVLRSTDDARWWLAVLYGMRQGEVLGLRWGDVDLEAGVLHVRQSLQTAEDGTLIFGPPKSRSSQRPVPLIPTMLARLRLAHAHTDDHSPDTLVFGRDDGSPRRPRADWQEWRDLLADLGLPPVALHAARNTAASLLEAAGVPERMAMQILGHSQVQMTHRYQSGAELARVADALDSVARLLELE